MIGVTRRAAGILSLSGLLGLPAAVLAHFAVFGQSHVLGGVSHALLMALCAACSAAAFAIACAIATRPARSIVAPSIAIMCASGAGWFALIELREDPHAVPLLPVIAALLLASLVMKAAWRGLENAAGAVRELIQRLRPVCAPCVTRVLSALAPALPVQAHSHRLLSRPPPV